MNNDRRKSIRGVINNLNTSCSTLESALSEEQDALYNIPESLQSTDRYSDMEDNVDVLNDAVCDLIGVIEMLEKIN